MTVALEQALIQRFIDGSFGLPVAYENKDFEPTAGEPYAEVSSFINDETPFSLNDSNETDGFLQIILRYPENDFSWDAKTKADQIRQVFKIGTRINTGDGRLVITQSGSDKGANEDGWYKLVLRFYFTAVIPR